MIAFLLNQVLSATYLLDEHFGKNRDKGWAEMADCRFSPSPLNHLFGMIFPSYWDVLVCFLGQVAHHPPTRISNGLK